MSPKSEKMCEEYHKVCDVLDKLTLDALTLMEEEIQLKLYIENAMCGGESHLAKSRYILGQNSVSSLQLPSEEVDINAMAKVVPNEDQKYLKSHGVELAVAKCDENIQNPLKWFGLLVPQNLHYAQKMFTQALQWVVQAANVQWKLNETCVKIEQLKEYKNQIKAK
ncbi:coiled-coil domain-containing protein 115 [Aethina tumida]|uniref:coiled-coil domain-containing protein 115 n=1 Tax=Aethina tumida TaxID=116153 RepID=UPI00096B422B|nr:coiled-coil domain-containing protein 115 [Aethina tumida]